MKTFSIEAKKRTELGKKSTKQMRAQELVPCVMYGGEEVLHFYATENSFRNLVFSNHVYLVEIDIEGKKHKAFMQDIQFHPVTDKILHIDFIEVFDDKPAVASLPIVLTGSSKGILAGGKLRQRRRYLKIKGLVKDMPEELVIDISKLNIGNYIKVKDINFNNLEILDPAQAMVVGIVSSRLAAKGLAVEEESDEGEETEGAGSGETAAEESSEG